MPTNSRLRVATLLFLFTSALTAAPILPLQARSSMTEMTGLYYVDVSGNDGNAGTAAAPWRSIQKAADTLSPGGTVLVNAGTYNERVSLTKSGNSGAPITFQAVGEVIMRGFSIQANYIKVIGFEITSTVSGTVSDATGVTVQGQYNEISNNYIHRTGQLGILLDASPADSTATSNNVVKNNRIAYAEEAGIKVLGANNLIEGNDISHTVQYQPGVHASLEDADGIRFFGSGSTFRKNYIHDITRTDPENQYDPHIDAFQTWGPATNMIFEQNLISKDATQQQSFTIEGLTQPVGSIMIRNNVFISRGTGYDSDVNTGGHGLVSNVTIVNNTMVAVNGRAEYAVWIAPDQRGVVVKNNATYDHGTSTEPYIRVDIGATDVDIGYNSVFKSDGQAPAGSAYPHDLWLVDPQFLNFSARDFHLRSTSPLTGGGVSLSSVSNDFDGAPRPPDAAPDIGAFRTNLPPVVSAGPSQTVTLPASAVLNGTATDDGLPLGSELTTIWSVVSGPGPVNFGNVNAVSTTAAFTTSGLYTLRLTASDSLLSSAANVVITVNAPLVANAGADQIVEAAGPNGTQVTLNGSATGGDPNTVTFNWHGPFGTAQGSKITRNIPIGVHIISLEVSDGQGGLGTSTVIITVRDSTPPVITAATAHPNVLWPPNHKLGDVAVTVQVSDNVDINPTCSIRGISSNQPINGTGDGNTAPDWKVIQGSIKGSGSLFLQLRAEHAGTGQSARIYTIDIGCVDVSGNLATKSTTVTVPFSSKK